eukprot:2594303-Rhodomonas_salina.3
MDSTKLVCGPLFPGSSTRWVSTGQNTGVPSIAQHTLGQYHTSQSTLPEQAYYAVSQRGLVDA